MSFNESKAHESKNEEDFSRTILFAGIGFAKSPEGNAELLRDLAAFRGALKGCLAVQPMLVGTSRKGFLGRLTGV